MVQETALLQIHLKEIMEDHLEVIVVAPEVELEKLVTQMVKAKVVTVQHLQLQDLQYLMQVVAVEEKLALEVEELEVVVMVHLTEALIQEMEELIQAAEAEVEVDLALEVEVELDLEL